MKTQLCKALVLLQALIVWSVCSAAPASPAGSWDFVISGDEFGTALIDLGDDGSVGGVQITTFKTQKNGIRIGGGDDRGTGGGSRGDEDSSVSTNVVTGPCGTNFSGGASISGSWTIDSRGRVVGYYYQRSMDPNATNANYELPVSFIGRYVAGKRLTLKAYNGCIVTMMRGIPSGSQPDASGNWLGVGKLNESVFVDQFFMFGAGPGYFEVPFWEGGGYSLTNGFAIVSAQRRMSLLGTRILVDPLQTNKVVRAVSGSINSRATRGVLQGQEGTNRVTAYKIELLAPAVIEKAAQ